MARSTLKSDQLRALREAKYNTRYLRKPITVGELRRATAKVATKKKARKADAED